MVPSQQLGGRGVGVSAASASEDAVGGQQAERPIQRLRVDVQARGELLGAHGLLADLVGHAERGDQL
jgi:hypothetical protein